MRCGKSMCMLIIARRHKYKLRHNLSVFIFVMTFLVCGCSWALRNFKQWSVRIASYPSVEFQDAEVFPVIFRVFFSVFETSDVARYPVFTFYANFRPRLWFLVRLNMGMTVLKAFAFSTSLGIFPVRNKSDVRVLF